MVCLPLIERELRTALRKQRPVRVRFEVAVLAACGSVVIFLIGASSGDQSLGRTLEFLLCLAGLWFVQRALVLTAGVLAEERRNQTLGLLFLSGLGAWKVFVSKFLSSALVAFTSLLAIFPMLALPFLLGGVSFELFLASTCMLPILMLFALAISLLASVLTRDEGSALVLAAVLAVLVCGVTPAISLAQSHFSAGGQASEWWWRLSPADAPRLILYHFGSAFGPSEQAEFWRNEVLTLCWSALALGAAGFALQRLWRDREEASETGGWRERWLNLWHGRGQPRRRLAVLWLDLNPFVWLAGRDRQPALLGWLVVSGIVLVWLLCWGIWRAAWPSVQNFLITATLLNSVLAWLTRHTAAQVLGQARQDGTYELLLTTSLEPREIVSGTLEALRGHFRKLGNFVLLLEVLMMWGGLATRPWTGRALLVYFLIWLMLIAWIWSIGRRLSRVLPVMWASLNCARPTLAVLRTSGFRPFAWVWIVFCLQDMGRGFRSFPSGSRGELVFVLLCAAVWLIRYVKDVSTSAVRMLELNWDPGDMVWVKGADSICQTRLIREFREIVREPLPDPGDPRFKRWNVRERFPWGWELVQQQLHERLARERG